MVHNEADASSCEIGLAKLFVLCVCVCVCVSVCECVYSAHNTMSKHAAHLITSSTPLQSQKRSFRRGRSAYVLKQNFGRWIGRLTL